MVVPADVVSAAKRGDYHSLLLLEAWLTRVPPPDPNEPYGRKSLLMHSAWAGRLGAMRLLLAHGASTAATNADGSNSLHFAAFYHHQKSAKNRDEAIALLLDHSVDINATSRSGSTPLIVVVGAFSAARLLVSRGADLAARDVYGQDAEAVADSVRVFFRKKS